MKNWLVATYKKNELNKLKYKLFICFNIKGLKEKTNITKQFIIKKNKNTIN